MLIRGEALMDTITLAFVISGKKGEWSVSVTQPGGIVTQDETVETGWQTLLDQLLSTAFKNVERQRRRTPLTAGNG